MHAFAAAFAELRTPSWLAALCLGGALPSACRSEPITGVRVAIVYDATPARLRLTATDELGGVYGPELLPDPPRPLVPGRESVLLHLPETLHGSTLELQAEGLDRSSAVMSRGQRRVRIVSRMVTDTELRLAVAMSCRDGSAREDGSCVPPEPSLDAALPEAGTLPEAGMPDAGASDAGPADAGCAADCMDGSRPDDVAEGARPPDAGHTVCRDSSCEPTCAMAATCTWNCAGAEECKGACGAGSTCMIDCTEANNCSAQCAGDSVCNLDCTGANNCRSKCGPNSHCTIQCAGANNCDEIECGKGAACIVVCADAENCAFKRCDGEQTECPDGTLVCGRACP